MEVIITKYSNLVTTKVPANINNYTIGRNGNKVDKIVIHHGATTNFNSIGNTFQNANRNASAHYGIDDNNIALYVSEDNTAWHASNWQANLTSIGIEVTNSTGKVNNNDSDINSWKILDTSYNTLIKLVADIAKRNNLGKLEKGKNIFGHRDYVDTFCPGNYLYFKLADLCSKANKLNNLENYINIILIDKKKVILNKDTKLWNLDYKEINDFKEVKSYSRGTIINDVVAIINHVSGERFYVTEYSYSKKINNGFNMKDCDDYIPDKNDEPVIDTPIIKNNILLKIFNWIKKIFQSIKIRK